MKYLYLDFEYNNTSEPKLNLVCCAFEDSEGKKGRVWLYHNKKKHEGLANLLKRYRDDGYIFVAYNATAEARGIISLGMDPRKVKWIDLHLEHKHLANENDAVKYGKQYAKSEKEGWRVVETKRPPNKWARTVEQDRDASNQAVTPSFVSACFKFLNIKADGERKDFTRDLIIADKDIEEHKQEILEYCESDVTPMPALFEAMKKTYVYLMKSLEQRESLHSEMLWRGEYAARTALLEMHGYPVKGDWIRNLVKNAPGVLKECQEDIMTQDLPVELFRWKRQTVKGPDGKSIRKMVNGKEKCVHEQVIAFNQKLVKEYFTRYVKEKGLWGAWKKTDKGHLSLDKEMLEKYFNPPQKYAYERDNIGQQLLRFKKLKTSLSGFLPPSGSKEIITAKLGSDDRIRPWFGIYGSKTARNQPPSTYFIPLKCAWMRCMVVPPPGKMMVSIDYGSQEFLLAALESGDKSMFEAYASGDPYMAFAKIAGAVPPDGSKADYKLERTIYKTITLGISYDLGKDSMARDLTNKTGKEFTPEQAQDLINQFHKSFPDWSKWRQDYIDQYQYVTGFCRLKDGWCLWGDEDNARTIGNFPMQGMGSCILRKGTQLIQDAGLKLLYSLHDAFYIECDFEDYAAVDLLARKMREAFMFYYEGELKERAGAINMDADVWSPQFSGISHRMTPGKIPVKTQRIYIDERGAEEFHRMKKYLKPIAQ